MGGTADQVRHEVFEKAANSAWSGSTIVPYFDVWVGLSWSRLGVLLLSSGVGSYDRFLPNTGWHSLLV